MIMSEGKQPTPSDHHLEVAVLTTSGRWPAGDAYEKEPFAKPLEEVLRQAAHALNLVGTDGWLATVGDRELDPKKSFAENTLTGKVLIQFGPRAGGGGGRA